MKYAFTQVVSGIELDVLAYSLALVFLMVVSKGSTSVTLRRGKGTPWYLSMGSLRPHFSGEI
jgi:hypothetical protein